MYLPDINVVARLGLPASWPAPWHNFPPLAASCHGHIATAGHRVAMVTSANFHSLPPISASVLSLRANAFTLSERGGVAVLRADHS